MGLPAPLIELFVQAHIVKKITGSVGFIARQTTIATSKTLQVLAERYGLPHMEDSQIELDYDTLAARQQSRLLYGRNLAPLPRLLYSVKRRLSGQLVHGRKVVPITDKCLMRFLGCDKLNFIDHSDYEKANIICDLNYPINEEMKGMFDFIYDGSCLDNIFNAGVGLSNISKLLRPGGRVIILEHSSNMNGPYLMFSPGWFNDFFAANNYADCKIYIARVKNNENLHYGPWELWYYDYLIRPDGNAPGLSLFSNLKDLAGFPFPIKERHLMCIVVAEKGEDSTDDVMPSQAQYRSEIDSIRLRLILEGWASKRTNISPSVSSSFHFPGQLPREFVRCNDLGKGLIF